jgi:hypothetical protein
VSHTNIDLCVFVDSSANLSSSRMLVFTLSCSTTSSCASTGLQLRSRPTASPPSCPDMMLLLLLRQVSHLEPNPVSFR